MSDTTLYFDWKKVASQISARNTNKDQQEQAFMNLAYGYVSQKAGKLMEDPHRLGFEIIYSNDDNSKMAGMFAFRVGSDLITVPAIYINNDVKGTELLYEHSTKLIRPLSVDWADHIISKHTRKEAQVQGKDITGRMTSGMQLERLANPTMHKRASAESAWEEVFKDFEASNTELGNVLQEYICDTGKAGLHKLAAAIEASMPFAEALYSLPEDIYLPPADLIKQAAEEKPTKILELYTRHFPLTKMAAEDNEKAHQRGWFLWENRKKADLKPVMRRAEELISEVGDPGKYNIVTADGSSAEGWVFNDHNSCGNALCSGTSNYRTLCSGTSNYRTLCSGTSNYRNEPRRNKDRIIVWDDGTTSSVWNKSIWGEPVKEEYTADQKSFYESLPEKPTVGGVYYAVLPQGSVVGHWKVRKINKVDDEITSLELANNYTYDDEKGFVAYINPTVDGYKELSGGYKAFGPNVRWLKVKHTNRDNGRGYDLAVSDKQPGDHDHMLEMFTKNDIKKVTMKKEPDADNFQVFEGVNVVADDVTGIEATVKTAAFLGISADDAMWMYDTAMAEGKAEIWMDGGMIKSAMQMGGVSMTQLGNPEFQTGYDSELNVATEGPQGWAINMLTGQPDLPAQHYGDAYDPTLGNSPGNRDTTDLVSEEAAALGIFDRDLFDNTPEDIAALYTEANIPNLFQHGTVGMLVSAYDSAAMISKYIPKLEEGLDHFGRILFLFYWKPQDFEKLYGADDLANLEQELLSQFKSFGDVLLQLIKKNEVKTGSVPTP